MFVDKNTSLKKLLLVICNLSVNLLIIILLIDLLTAKACQKKKNLPTSFFGIFIDEYDISLTEKLYVISSVNFSSVNLTYKQQKGRLQFC